MRFLLEAEVAAVLGKTRPTRQAAMAVVVALVVTQKRCLTLSREPIQHTKLLLEMAAHLWRQQHRGVLLGSMDKRGVQLLRLALLRKVGKRAVRIRLVLLEVPVVAVVKGLLRPIHKEMAAATAVMVLRRKAVLAKAKALQPESSEKAPGNSTLEEAAAVAEA